MAYYTGVGSRETPAEMVKLMQEAAHALYCGGWTLRSGAAEGADAAFEGGWLDGFVSGQSKVAGEIYIPWNGFGGLHHGDYDGCVYSLANMGPIGQRAAQIASSIHPAWEHLTQGARKLHTRNVFQVLGQNLECPSKFLVCWAETDKHGVPKGGTRTAWVLAERHGTECFNLFIDEDRQRITEWLSKGQWDTYRHTR